MKKACFVVAIFLSCSLASSAQRYGPHSGGTAKARAPVYQTGLGGSAPAVTTGPTAQPSASNPGPVTPPSSARPRDCDSGDSGYSNYGPGGFPVYPGPNAPLPPQGTYYANPYGYYNYNNPYNPYGYSNNTAPYDTGYYTNGLYSNGAGGYWNGATVAPPSNGPTFPSFQNYNSGPSR